MTVLGFEPGILSQKSPCQRIATFNWKSLIIQKFPQNFLTEIFAKSHKSLQLYSKISIILLIGLSLIFTFTIEDTKNDIFINLFVFQQMGTLPRVTTWIVFNL